VFLQQLAEGAALLSRDPCGTGYVTFGLCHQSDQVVLFEIGNGFRLGFRKAPPFGKSLITEVL
jgi:hypothetical protein